MEDVQHHPGPEHARREEEESDTVTYSTEEAFNHRYSYEKEKGLLNIERLNDNSVEHMYDADVIGIIDYPPQKILQVTAQPFLDGKPGTRYAVIPQMAFNLPSAYTDRLLLREIPEHLRIPPFQDNARDLHVVISVGSGLGEAQQFYDKALIGALRAWFISSKDWHTHVTESERSVTELVEQIILPRANDGVKQTIVLLSGDGGVVDVVNALLLSPRGSNYVKPILGLIYLGTGNALAHSSGLDRDRTQGLRNLLSGTPRSLPIFTARFSPGSVLLTDEGRKKEPLPLKDGHPTLYGVVVCSWALHASLVADSDTTKYRRHGAKRFQMAGKRLLRPKDGSKAHVYDGKITLYKTDDDGEVFPEEIAETKTAYIVATLVSNFESRLCISPRSRPLDGQLRVVRFGDVPAEDVMRLLGMAYRAGAHMTDKMVQYEPIEGLRIEMNETESRWRRICVDGKVIQVEEGGWVEVRKGSEDVVDLVV
ncbi:MAG: hypothetical protein Q9219_005387 [cf. Caloplaca sp. 3 TL-2023]